MKGDINMNYNVADIGNLSLKKELLYGYNRTQVENILAKVKEDYFELVQKNNDLQNEIKIMTETVQHYKTIEESLQHALLVAHSAGETIKTNATEKADTIIQEAEVKAKKLVDDADSRVKKLKNEYKMVKNSINNYKLRTQTLLSSLQDLLEKPFEESDE